AALEKAAVEGHVGDEGVRAAAEASHHRRGEVSRPRPHGDAEGHCLPSLKGRGWGWVRLKRLDAAEDASSWALSPFVSNPPLNPSLEGRGESEARITASAAPRHRARAARRRAAAAARPLDRGIRA